MLTLTDKIKMNKKIKLALISLLGFSAACSTVRRNAATPDEKSAPEQPTEGENKSAGEGVAPVPETDIEVRPSIRLMYGVPAPLDGRVVAPVPEETPSEKNVVLISDDSAPEDKKNE